MTKEIQHYKGLEIKADLGLHEQIVNIIEMNFEKNISIADIGCGEGALALRLYDRGYHNINCYDINTKQFKAPNIAVREIDANLPLSTNIDKKFDLIIAVEIIEHVYSSYNLLSELKQLLKPCGNIILSTPNIQSSLSRIIFMLTGNFHQFQNTDLSYGHINPVSSFAVRNITNEIGVEIISITPGGTWKRILMPEIRIYKGIRVTIKTIIGNLIMFILSLLYPLMKGDKDGWVLIYLIRSKT